MERIDNFRVSEEKEHPEIEKLKYTLKLLDNHILHMYEISYYLTYHAKNDTTKMDFFETEGYHNALIIKSLLGARIKSCKEKEAVLYRQIEDLRKEKATAKIKDNDKCCIGSLEAFYDRVKEGFTWNGKKFTNCKDYIAEIDKAHTAIFGKCEKE